MMDAARVIFSSPWWFLAACMGTAMVVGAIGDACAAIVKAWRASRETEDSRRALARSAARVARSAECVERGYRAR